VDVQAMIGPGENLDERAWSKEWQCLYDRVGAKEMYRRPRRSGSGTPPLRHPGFPGKVGPSRDACDKQEKNMLGAVG